MGNRIEDDEEQIEWCRQWADEQARKRARRRHRIRTTLAWLLAAVGYEGREDCDERKS